MIMKDEAKNDILPWIGITSGLENGAPGSEKSVKEGLNDQGSMDKKKSSC